MSQTVWALYELVNKLTVAMAESRVIAELYALNAWKSDLNFINTFALKLHLGKKLFLCILRYQKLKQDLLIVVLVLSQRELAFSLLR